MGRKAARNMQSRNTNKIGIQCFCWSYSQGDDSSYINYIQNGVKVTGLSVYNDRNHTRNYFVFSFAKILGTKDQKIYKCRRKILSTFQTVNKRKQSVGKFQVRRYVWCRVFGFGVECLCVQCRVSMRLVSNVFVTLYVQTFNKNILFSPFRC